MPAPDIHTRLLQPLHASGIAYMVTGGLAAIIYGEPRLTNDVDIVVRLTSLDAQRLLDAYPVPDYYAPPLEVIQTEAARSAGRLDTRPTAGAPCIVLLTAYRSMAPDPRDPPRSEVLQGTLEMLVLTLLTGEPMHGWGISLRLRRISRDVFDVNQGSLYPALQRMKGRGWVRAEWRATENNRRARYYAITREGRKQLEAEIAGWQRSSGAVDRVLRHAFP